MSRHANISVFVPHLGCPNMCSFCNQRYIAGDFSPPDESDIESAVEIAVKSRNYSPQNTEIAFFGGSFTAIDRDYMVRLLECASRFVKNGTVKGIRISTRPDAVDKQIIDILKFYGVTAIELGAQSMCDDVLLLNKRGHTSADVETAARLIKQNGFELGLQMMTGLYGSNNEKDMYTARKIAQASPESVRIYPTIVLRDTELEKRVLDGEYTPQTVEQAVDLCCDLLLLFKSNNINVIRTGLHTIDESKYVAGPWHPAFSELCRSEIFYRRITDMLKDKPAGRYTVKVNKSDVSKCVGQHKNNILKLKKQGYLCTVVADGHINADGLLISGSES